MVRFEGFEWAPGGEYLFFRNCYPEFTRLKPQMLSRPAAAAYTCQCTWRHASGAGLQRLEGGPDMRWICSGHAAGA